MTDYQIFAKGMHADGHISDMEMAVYLKWYNYCIEHVKPRVDGIIYLRALPETCLGRINQRARAGEDVIDLEYLTKLHVAHEDWLLKRDDVFVADAANQLDMATIVSFIQGRIAALASPNPRMSII